MEMETQRRRASTKVETFWVHDVIGKPLFDWARASPESIPDVIFSILYYISTDKSDLKPDGLDRQTIEKLTFGMAFADYECFQSKQNAFNYLLHILREINPPLCPSDLYYKLMYLDMSHAKRIDGVRSLHSQLRTINELDFNTLYAVFLIVKHVIIQQPELNTKICQEFSRAIFRPTEVTEKDIKASFQFSKIFEYILENPTEVFEGV